MMYPLVRDLAVDGIPVTVTCRVLGFTPQGYYKWRSNPVSRRDWDDAHLVDAARQVHADERMKASLAVAALRNAIALRGSTRTVVHSDRGSQFRSGKFVRTLRDNGLVGSMGRTGTCADNAAMESFFALLQRNVLDRKRWNTREELRLAIVIWIERTYHRRRRQRALGKLTPIEFEAVYGAARAA